MTLTGIHLAPTGDQVGHHRAGRSSAVARACKTKPFSVLTQQRVNNLLIALGPPGAHLDPLDAHWDPLGAHWGPGGSPPGPRSSGVARACKTKPFSVLTQQRVNNLLIALGPPGAHLDPLDAHWDPLGAHWGPGGSPPGPPELGCRQGL